MIGESQDTFFLNLNTEDVIKQSLSNLILKGSLETNHVKVNCVKVSNAKMIPNQKVWHNRIQLQEIASGLFNRFLGGIIFRESQ